MIIAHFCRSGNITQLFPVKDYTVSGESFIIYRCDECSGMFTQDVPEQEAMVLIMPPITIFPTAIPVKDLLMAYTIK
jgi:hypothetical protein